MHKTWEHRNGLRYESELFSDLETVRLYRAFPTPCESRSFVRPPSMKIELGETIIGRGWKPPFHSRTISPNLDSRTKTERRYTSELRCKRFPSRTDQRLSRPRFFFGREIPLFVRAMCGTFAKTTFRFFLMMHHVISYVEEYAWIKKKMSPYFSPRPEDFFGALLRSVQDLASNWNELV